MIFSKRLKQLRTTKMVSQKQLADFLCISAAAIRRWEADLSVPTGKMIKKLANFFRVSADYLLGRSDDFEIAMVKADKKGEYLSAEEKELIKNYRHLSAEWKNQVQTYIELINQKN